VDDLARLHVADLKPKEIVDAGVDHGAGAVHGERTDVVRERAHGLHDGVRLRVRNRHRVRAQPCHEDLRAVRAPDRVVHSATLEPERFDQVAGLRVDDTAWPSSVGTYMVLLSGEIAIRSQQLPS
jgi:hypothetical protein